MTSKSKVTLSFIGKSDKLESAFDSIGKAGKDMASKVDSAADDMGNSLDSVGKAAKSSAKDFDKASSSARDMGDRFDATGEAAGTLDQRAMGFRDTITGVQDTFKGLTDDSLSLQERFLTLGMGIGDLASGVENLGAPLLKSAKQWASGTANMIASNAKMVASSVKSSAKIAATWVANAAKATVATIASVAKQVAAWVLLGVQSLLAAAKVALAWLISIGPIVLVAAAVIGLVVLIVKNWDTIAETAKKLGTFLLDTFKGFIDWVKSNWPLLLAILTGPIGIAVALIVKHWDTIKSGFTSVKNWISDKIGDIVSFFSALPGRIAGFISSIWDKMKNGATEAKDWVKGRVDDIVAFFRGLPGRLASALGGLVDNITKPFRDAYNAVLGIWNKITGVQASKSFGTKSGSKSSSRATTSTGRRPGTGFLAAKGAYVRASPGGSLLTVGEGGKDEAILPIDKLNKMMGQGSGPTVIEIRSGGTKMDDMLVELLRKSIANRGGTVQAVLG